MKVEHLDTAARLSKKRKALKGLQDLLGPYVNCAEVKVTVEIGDKTKEASIRNDVFNALLYKLVEDEIQNLDKFVESL